MIWQHLIDGVLTGAIISLGAIGVTLSMSILRFANFGHAELVTWGAYVALTFVVFLGVGEALGPLSFGWSLIVATIATCILTGLIALVVDWLVFRHLRRQGAAKLTLVFASFGAGLILRNLIVLIYGPDAEYFSRELQIAILLFGTVRVMPDQIFVLGLALVIVVSVHLVLRYSALGIAMRASAENPALAQVSGIDSERMVQATWAISGALAALAGVFLGLTVQIRPDMGFSLLLPLFGAAILGGTGSVIGAVIGGMIIGLAENLSVMVISPGYKSAVPFLLLLVILYVRPSGLFGARQ